MISNPNGKSRVNQEGTGSTRQAPPVTITWTEEFETGIPKLDQQHRWLIENINVLGDLLSNPVFGAQETDLSFLTLDYLAAYSDVHFRGEEQCMESYRCPVHQLNQTEHQRFHGFIVDYKKQCDAEGFKRQRLQKVHDLMCVWIVEHIKKVDTNLKSCVKTKPAT